MKGHVLIRIPVILLLSGLAAVPLVAQTHVAHTSSEHEGTSALERMAHLEVADVPLGSALSRLADASGVPIAFSPSAVEQYRHIVSCSCATVTVGGALDSILSGTSFTHAEFKGQVIVYRRPAPQPIQPVERRLYPDPLGAGAMFARAAATDGSGTLFAASSQARQGTIVGRVLDAQTGQPIPAAQVSLGENLITALTQADGGFTLPNVPAGTHVVRAERLGYQPATTEVTVADGQTVTIEILLNVAAIGLDEIIAVGYGSVRRRDVTGSIASVNAEDLLSGRGTPPISIANALVGRAAGVHVVSNVGSPGSAPSIRIRGTNSISASAEPLYIVDGIPLTTAAGNAIDPSNIESIQILKDASATAIYGARGANGVVLITTRRGSPGEARFILETGFGMQSATKRFEVLTGPEYRALANEAAVNANVAPPCTEEEVANAPTYDYLGAIMQNWEWQPQRSHSLTVSGGDERTRYLFSANYVYQEGLILNSDFERYGVRVNVDRNVSDRFRLGASLSGTRSEQNVSATVSTAVNNAVGVTAAMQYDPATPFKDENGEWIKSRNLGIQLTNPIAELSERRNPNYGTNLLASLYAEYDILPGLVARSNFGANLSFGYNPFYAPGSIQSGNEIGTARVSRSERTDWTNENTLTYNGELGPGTISAVVGTSIQTSSSESVSAESRGFDNDRILWYDLSLGYQIFPPTTSYTDWTIVSQLGRVSYNLRDRYLFTFTVRRDGSSRFGAANKWAIFPSGAFTWRLVDEPFMANQTLFSDFRVRLSYGRTGNQAITPYQSLVNRPGFPGDLFT